MVTATQAAVEKLKTLREGEKALRVSVAGGGCSGLSYKLEWVEPASISSNDKLMVVDDIKIVIDPKSYIYLVGMELNYTDGLDGVGFSFVNPNAKRVCGCGSSFST
jgi:iron-sulfur cluster assembly protein